MPTAVERLKHVTLKVKRASEHVADLERGLRTFLESRPYEVGTRYDPETRKLIYYVTRADQIPDCLPLIAGDAIQNLVSALDHLAYQIVCNDTSDKPPNANRIYFPVAEDAAKYQAKKRYCMEGARQETFDAIDALKPYKGGNDFLWALHRLNNIEKHRLLLTVGSQAAGVNLGQLMAGQLGRGPFPAEAVTAFESMDIFLKPAEVGLPLKAGFELYIGVVDEKPNPNQQFRFEVALSEPGIVDGKPLLETVNHFSATVDGIVSALAPRLDMTQ